MTEQIKVGDIVWVRKSHISTSRPVRYSEQTTVEKVYKTGRVKLAGYEGQWRVDPERFYSGEGYQIDGWSLTHKVSEWRYLHATTSQKYKELCDKRADEEEGRNTLRNDFIVHAALINNAPKHNSNIEAQRQLVADLEAAWQKFVASKATPTETQGE